MPRIVSISQKKNLMDAPDDRKVHPIPVPRLGGISFLPLTMMSIFLFNILYYFFVVLLFLHTFIKPLHKLLFCTGFRI